LIRREAPNGLNIDVLSADLEAALAAPGTDTDVLIQARDQVRVFSLEADRGDAMQPLIAELRLQSSQKVPTKLVSVAGRVKAPGQYPLEPGMRVSDLIRAGGNLAEAAYVLEAELTRFSLDTTAERQTNVINVSIDRILAGDTAADFVLTPHDVLTIKLIPNWSDLESVSIEGEVRFPGTYPIRRGERISSVIGRAGGLTEVAFADGAVFLRAALRQQEQRQLKELAGRIESEVTLASTAAAETSDPESAAARQALLNQLDATVATGRLVIDLPQILSSHTEDRADIAMQDGDRVLIPQQTHTVTIIGEVQYPTSHVFDPAISRNEYIDMSGGASQNADKKRIYVVRADGAVVMNSGSRFLGKRNSIDIRPGDTIVVPLDANRVSKLTLWTNVTTIIYNIAIAAAAVASFSI
jgi:protein involved in polysaccharide export with SLBB domain